MKNLFFTSTLVLTLSGCVSLDSAAPDVSNLTQQGWSTASAEASLEQNWWQHFGSTELDALVSRALSQNTNVVAAVQRITQARLQVKIAGANALPTVDASAGAGRTLTTRNNDTSGNNNLNAGLNVGYELDLFGGNAANRRSARQGAEATAQDAAALKLVTAADTVRAYASVLSLNDRTKLAKQNLTLAEDVLKLLQVRFDAGVISGLELAQQQGSVASQRNSVSNLRQQQGVALTTLAVLVGAAPQGFAVSSTSLSSLKVPTISARQPSAVLAARPDIKAAEARLLAADADIDAARAALFPSLQLGAGAGWAFDPASQSLNVAANLLAPIFNGGSLRNQFLVSKSREQELLQNYRGTVLQSFKEVEDALAATAATKEQLTHTTQARAAAEQAYAIARVRLDQGAINMPTLLSTQQADVQAEDGLVQAQLNSINAAATLALALGGGWQENPAE